MTDLEVVLQHGEFLSHLARGLVDDDAAAEDLEQDVWLALLARRTRPAGEDEVRSWRAWLTRVAQNLASNRRRSAARRSKREAEVNPPQPLLTPEEISRREELRRRVIGALFKLEEPYLSTLLYRFYEELAPSEIAVHTDVPVDTVKTRLRRGIALLRSELDREFGERSHWLHAFVPLLGGLPATSSTSGPAVLTWLGVFVSFKKVAVVLIAVVGLIWYATSQPSDSPLSKSSDTSGSSAPILQPPALGEQQTTASLTASDRSGVHPPDTLTARDHPQGTDRGGAVDTTGTVSYPDEDPVEGIEVIVRQSTRPGVTQAIGSAKTNQDGEFTLSRVPAGPIQVELRFADGAYRHRFELDSIAELPNPIVIDRNPSVFLAGRVIGDGAPPSRLDFWLLRPDGVRSMGSVSWEDSALRNIASGAYDIYIQAEGFPSLRTQFTVERDDIRIPVTLDSTLAHEVHVVSAEGRSVPDASVRISVRFGRSNLSSPPAITDASGTVEAFLQPGQSIEVSAEGHASRFVDVTADKIEGRRLTVTLPTTGSLTVEVVDARGKTVDGIRVDYRSTTRGAPTDLVLGTLANRLVAPITKDGKAEIFDLPAGAYRLMFKRDGRTLGMLDVPLAAGEAGRATFTVPDERLIRGTVTLDGKPVTSGVVRCGTARAPVADDGSFTLTLSRLGQRAVAYHPSPSDDESWGGYYRVSEEESLSLDFWMASLRATVLDPDGKPLANVSGALSGPSNREFVSDEDGLVALDSMIAGEYRWRIRSTEKGYAPTTVVHVEGDTYADYQLLASREVHIVVRQPETQQGWVVRLEGLGAGGERWSIPGGRARSIQRSARRSSPPS